DLGEIDARAINSIEIGEGITLRVGRYGAYVEQIARDEDGTPIEGADPRRANVSDEVAPDELTVEKAEELLERAKDDGRVLGTDPETGHEIVAKDGRYGPYVTEVLPEQVTADGKKIPKSKQPKPRTGSLLKSMDLSTVTLEDALKLLRLPRVVGTAADGVEITAQNGRYGPYMKKGTDSRSLETEEQIFSITLEEAEKIYAQPKARGRAAAKPPLKELGTDPTSEKPIVIKDGRFGPYITDGTTNVSLRATEKVGESAETMAVETLAEKRSKGPAKKKAPAKRTTSRKKSTTTKKQPRRGSGDRRSRRGGRIPHGCGRLARSGTAPLRPLTPQRSLHRSCGESADDAALEDQHHDDQRHRHDHAGGHLRAVRGVELRDAGELRDRHVRGLHQRRVHHRQGDEELVPGRDEGDDRRGEHPGRGQRQDDPQERPESGGPVDHRRLFELHRQLPEERVEVPHRQRQREGDRGQDHRLVGVDPVEREPHESPAEQLQQRHHEGDDREHRGRHDEEHDQHLAAEIEPRQRVGAEHAQHEHQDRGAAGDDQRVQQGAGEVVRRVEDGDEVLDADRAGDQLRRPPLGGLAQRRDDHPVERREAVHQDERH